MSELFVELHEGHPEQPTAILIAVNDIRLIGPKTDADMALLANVTSPAAYKTRIIFKGDSWVTFVHEPPHEVSGLCGFKVSR